MMEHLGTMNEEQQHGTSSIYSSTFAQVIFVNVGKLYTTDVPIKCNYTLTPMMTAHKKDWIGIFKVGWSTARDYHTFVWAPLPKEDSHVERQQQVTFEAYYLPKDDNDFYQFCYVTQKGEIRGASTPFGFRLAGCSTPDQLENDYSQEMLIITTQEKLEESEKEKDELKVNNLKLSEENTTLKEKIKQLETQTAKEKEEYSVTLEMNKKESMGLDKQLLELKIKSELEMKAQNEKLEQLRKDLIEKEAACLNVQKENQIYSFRYKNLLAKMESSQASVEQLKQKNEKAVEKLIRLQQESKQLRTEISAKETELASLTEIKNKTANELSAAQESLELVQFDYETHKKANEKKLMEMQNQQQNCMAEVFHLRQALSKSEELKSSNAKAVEQLQQQVENLQQRLKDMENQMQVAQQQQVQTMAELRITQDKQEQSEKNLFEAQQEIQHWKSKFEKVDQIFSEKEACAEGGITADHPIQKEIANLKAKLLTGKSCYVQKYKECQRLHKQIDKLKALLEDKNKCHSPIKEIAEITETETANSGGLTLQQPGTELAEIRTKLGDRSEEAVIRYADIERELEDKTHVVGIRNMEVAELQEEIQKLNKKIDELRFSSSHRSATFKLEHPNPYSLSVPKVHSAHSGLLFGNPYSECDFQESQSTESADLEQNLDSLEHSQNIEENPPVERQKCPVCFIQFQLDMDESNMEKHISMHFGHECPICQVTFPENKQETYATHVQSHFW
ncbi:tax1-binding protein 1 homolog B-like isoform X3 [Narcine bancroftii]|uniref:tax1-binding protein 1 homolog B-like isoform X3 n=1 Tax=Narcine bancroftii TaxID=1343680 RepID=UPI00383161CB